MKTDGVRAHQKLVRISTKMDHLENTTIYLKKKVKMAVILSILDRF